MSSAPCQPGFCIPVRRLRLHWDLVLQPLPLFLFEVSRTKPETPAAGTFVRRLRILQLRPDATGRWRDGSGLISSRLQISLRE